MKKLLVSTLTGLIFLFSFAPNLTVLAQTTTTPTTNSTTWYNQSFLDWYGKVYDVGNPNEIFGERYTAAQVQWIIYGIWGFLINAVTGPQNAGLVQCFLSNYTDIKVCSDQLTKLISSTDSSDQALATNTSQNQSLWSLVFATDRPISAISYVKEKIDNFNPIPVAHAQTPGFGFNVLKPIQSMWVGIRNISYGLFVVATVILAFMIMFRVKINPQTVISIQSAIPKVTIALILTTFSYAIAGLVIDLMYVVIGFICLGTSSIVFQIPAATLFKFLTQSNILLVLAIYLVVFVIAFIALLTMSLGVILTAATAGIVTALVVSTSGAVGVIIIFLLLILIAVVGWTVFKIIWTLVKAFATTILLVIFGPLQIAAGVILPNFGFNAWLKSLATALSTFIVTGVLLLFSIIFLVDGVVFGLKDFFSASPGSIDLGQTILHFIFGTNLTWTFGLSTANVPAGWPPLLGGGTSSMNIGLLFLVVSFVLFTMIPKATELIQSVLAGKPFGYGTSIGELTGPAGSLYGGYAGAQLAGGTIPAPFNRIPQLQAWYDRIFQTEEAKRSAGRQVEELFRPKR